MNYVNDVGLKMKTCNLTKIISAQKACYGHLWRGSPAVEIYTDAL